MKDKHCSNCSKCKVVLFPLRTVRELIHSSTELFVDSGVRRIYCAEGLWRNDTGAVDYVSIAEFNAASLPEIAAQVCPYYNPEIIVQNES